MHNRVEITGINTKDLKPMANSVSIELIKKSQLGDYDARDNVVLGNLLLVLSVVKKFNNRKENVDDLFQVGTIGLIKAIDNFDTTLGVMFSTYAVPMIIGEIRRYLRDNSALRISRSLKDIAYKALKYKEEYVSVNQKEPTTKEISDYLGVEEVDVVVSLEAILEPISIYTPIYSNGSDEIYLIDQIKDNVNSLDKMILEMTVEDGLKRLNARERQIINDRYYENKTQMEIAKEIGISQAQVSRLEKNALKIIFDVKDSK